MRGCRVDVWWMDEGMYGGWMRGCRVDVWWMDEGM